MTPPYDVQQKWTYWIVTYNVSFDMSFGGRFACTGPNPIEAYSRPQNSIEE